MEVRENMMLRHFFILLVAIAVVVPIFYMEKIHVGLLTVIALNTTYLMLNKVLKKNDKNK